MSKITKEHIEVIKREIDHWNGKVSMDVFADHIAKILNIGSLSRGTIYNAMKDFPELKPRFDAARERYRDGKALGLTNDSGDKQLDEARSSIERLKAENKSLKDDINRLNQVIVQMLYNAYYEKMRLENLTRPVERAVAEKVLQDPVNQAKVAFFNKPLPPGKPV